MGIPVMVLGESGSGKSASLRNFEPDEIGVLNVASKPLPFKKKLKAVNHANYQTILKALSKPTMKSYVIDDSQYLMAFYMFDKLGETGYGKFTQCAKDFYGLVRYIIESVPDDVIVYFLHHTERSDDGRLKAKTSGKMLDNQLTVEGLFSIVLMCQTDGKSHKFITQSDGYTTAKSPMEMLPAEMDNDLKAVDTAIREYYFGE